MAQFSRTWWGKRFIEALETFTESNRLGRGRSYARNGKIKSYQIQEGTITAHVRGSINPYFGVYKEPLYNTKISLTSISSKNWSKVMASITSKASWVSQLLMNEVPDNIEEAFQPLNLHLLPHNRQDFKTRCSCPDSANSCKHIAGVYYLIAESLDLDPFLLFELRGMNRQQLHIELEKSPVSVDSYYTPLQKTPLPPLGNPQNYWLGNQPLPQTLPEIASTTISAICVKKGGDFPPFWERDNSFIEVMEDFYQRVRQKNPDLK